MYNTLNGCLQEGWNGDKKVKWLWWFWYKHPSPMLSRFLILIPPGPSSSSLLPRFSPTECPLGRGGTVTGQTACPPLFQQPVPPSTALHVPDCSARVREGDTPTLPIGSGGGSRQASSTSPQAFHGSPPALGRAMGTKFQPCFSRAISEEFPELKLNLKPFQGGGVRSKPHYLKTCSDRGSALHTKMNNK